MESDLFITLRDYNVLFEQTAERAGIIAMEGTSPLTHNGFKVNLLKNLVMRSIRDEPMGV